MKYISKGTPWAIYLRRLFPEHNTIKHLRPSIKTGAISWKSSSSSKIYCGNISSVKQDPEDNKMCPQYILINRPKQHLWHNPYFYDINKPWNSETLKKDARKNMTLLSAVTCSMHIYWLSTPSGIILLMKTKNKKLRLRAVQCLA